MKRGDLQELLNLSVQQAQNKSGRCYIAVALGRIKDTEERENARTACKANGDGECDWTACPQREHYLVSCPLLEFALIEEGAEMSKTQAQPKTEPKALEPIDLDRCQAEVPTGHSFMTLGPRPKSGRVRCANKPSCIAVEREPGADGQHGAMSLCANCYVVFVQQMPNHAVFAMLPKKKD